MTRNGFSVQGVLCQYVDEIKRGRDLKRIYLDNNREEVG